MSGHCRVTPLSGGATGCVSEPAATFPFAIGEIAAVVGSCTLARAGDDPVQIKLGDEVCRGDIIETAARGNVSIRFIDGTVFELADSARMVLREFAGDTAPSARFDISNGTFNFIAGEMAKSGRLEIATPVANIRGGTRSGGIGMLSLASLVFAAMEQVQAGPSDTSFLDDGNIRFKDLTSDYGVIELTTADGRTILLDDPGETIVLRRVGSSVSESHVTNSLTTMLSYAQDQANALRVFALGPSGPAGNGSNGSGTLFVEPTSATPINFTPPPNNNFVPLNLLGVPGGSGSHQDVFVPFIEPQQPIPPPAITISPTITTETGVIATIVSGGVTRDNTPTLTGTVSDPNGLSSVTVHVFEGSTDLGAATVDPVSGTWNFNFTPTNALPDGPHSFTATATDTAAAISVVTSAISVTIDTTPPSETISSTIGTPTGATTTIQSGGVTKDDTLTLTGTVTDPNGVSSVHVFDGSTDLGTATIDGSGNWTFITSALSDGPHDFTAKATDNAGNTSAPTPLVTATIDTTAPAGNTPDLIPASDSGASNSDNITDVTSPTFSVGLGPTSQVGDTVELLLGGSSLAHAVTHTITQADIDAGCVSLTVTAGDLGADGVKSIAARFTDTAGNTTTTGALAITLDATAPNVTPTSASVYEAALDTSKTGNDLGAGTVTGSDPSSPGETATGTLTFSDADGPVIVTGVATGNVGGTVSGNVGTIITGNYGLLEVDQNGNYTYTLTRPYTTSPPANNGAETEFGKDVFTYTVKDNAGNTSTSTISIDIVDDRPTANPVSGSGQARSPDTNLLITLDLSGSMDESSGTGGLTKLQLAKQAILNLVQQYDSIGHVKVELVTFSDTATDASGGWIDMSDPAARATLVNTILGLQAGGSTNYDAALAEDMTAYNAGAAAGQLLTTPGVQNVAYFLSDGEPTVGDGNTSVLRNAESGGGSDAGIQGTLITGEQGIWTSFLNSNDIDSFALGMGPAASKSALDPVAFDGRGPTGTNTDGIVVKDLSQLISTLVSTVSASPVSGDLVGSLAANFGADGGHFLSLVVDGVTYTFDGVNAISVSDPSHNHEISFNSTTDVLTVGTSHGGTIALDMAGANVGQYVYTPAANTSSVTEQFQFNIVDGDGDIAGSTLTVQITPPPAQPANQVLNGSNNADTLNGGPGNDILIGNGGADTLNGGPGSDILIGGPGSDTFVFKSIADSPPGPGHFDVITDFTHNSDHIDISAIAGATNVQGQVGAANTVAANSISWFVDNAHNQTIVYVNTTATADHVDMEIHLTGTNINLAGSDILHHA